MSANLGRAAMRGLGRAPLAHLRGVALPSGATLRPWATCGPRFLALPTHTVLTMPALSPTMTAGNIASWLKKEGESVRAGDTIALVETDKATVDFEVLDDGIVAKLLVADGASDLPVGTPVAVIVEEAGDVAAFKDYKAVGEPAAAAAAPPAPAAPAVAAPPPAPTPAAAAAPVAAPRAAVSSGSAPASPLARRMAAATGMDLASIAGSGLGGRIIAVDVEAAQAAAVAAPAMAVAAPAAFGVSGALFEDVPHNNIRKIIAKRLTDSKRDVPHYYLATECVLDELVRLRANANASLEKADKLSVNDFIIKASAKALVDVPQANSAWFDDFVRTYKHADVCVAVSTDKGLITPIIAKAELKTLSQISAETKELAGRARANKLKPEEFMGGTFTVSNLGMFGVKNFTAIINPPQACILAVGGMEKKVVSDGKGGFKEVSVMIVSLSADHRVIDGAVGAQWLAAFKKYIENPVLMLV
mmetsp:Transcript_1567/g.3900  ORF Transcript_1567/g.3900 Transcript_1567/m.3900 type:complete len:474 (-) Transcript_1567:264-1685(-)